MLIITADVADCTIALDILVKTDTFLPVRECCFIADKGYDTKNIYNTIRNKYQGEYFIPINGRNTKNPKMLSIGHPICDAGLAMNKDGKDHFRNRTRQKFSCPFKLSKNDSACPCNHKCWSNGGKKSRGCTKYITIPDDYRLSIDRSSIEFKSVYALRSECERYNSVLSLPGRNVFGSETVNNKGKTEYFV